MSFNQNVFQNNCEFFSINAYTIVSTLRYKIKDIYICLFNKFTTIYYIIIYEIIKLFNLYKNVNFI